MDDFGAPQLLRMRDLADGRELVLRDDDAVALAVECSAETSPLTPWDTEVVTATSSASAWRSPATADRNASLRSTQNSHSAPFASHPASHPSTASRTRCDSAPCEHELRYVVVSKIGNSLRIASPIRVAAVSCVLVMFRLSQRFGGVVIPKNRATPSPALRKEWGASER